MSAETHELPNSCAECEHLKNGFTELAPCWECGLESGECVSVLVEGHDGKPFSFRPFWCQLNRGEVME